MSMPTHRNATHVRSSIAQAVTQLPPETLHQIVKHCGIEACGDLLTLATPSQLTAVLDLDLWHGAHPGADAHFDVDRFGTWLEVLVDAGDDVAARTVAALDASLTIAGLSRYVRIFDPGTFEPTAQSDDEPMDRHEMMHAGTSRDMPECEIGGYLVRARRADTWDAILALLAALDTNHADDFHAIMQGCRRLSHSRPEVDGLDDLLQAPEQSLHDLAVDREHRHAERGFVTPADARAFLEAARHVDLAVTPATTSDVSAAAMLAGAWLHVADGTAAGGPDARQVPTQGADHPPAPVDTIVGQLIDAGVVPDRQRRLLRAAADVDDTATNDFPLLKRLMTHVRHRVPAAFEARSHELVFLTNALMAGCAVQSRPFTPQEASEAAASVCHLGLECWSPRGPLPDAFLADHDLIAVFEVGWSVLHRDVSLFVADRLLAVVDEIHTRDVDTRRGLGELARRLATDRRAGTPWLARGATDVLATLDVTAWMAVRGLLDECPILPAALTAILERRIRSVSPTAFRFISTRAQIGDVRVFMRALPRLLAG